MTAIFEALDQQQEPVVTRHRLSVADYHRMAEAGVLAHDARVELIEGEIIDMAPTGTRHYWAVLRLSRLLHRAVADRAIVAGQSSLRLNDFNEPEPDLVLLDASTEAHDDRLPVGSDALLVVEVSDTSLAYDVKTKATLYARHGVPEYWVIDLRHRKLHRFTQPKDGTWGSIQTIDKPGVLELPGLPGLSIDVGSVL